jgi:hypothetical protein
MRPTQPRRSGAPDKGQNAMAIFMSAFNPIERRLLEGMPKGGFRTQRFKADLKRHTNGRRQPTFGD